MFVLRNERVFNGYSKIKVFPNRLGQPDMYYKLIIIHLFVLPYKKPLDIRYSTLIFKPLLFTIAQLLIECDSAIFIEIVFTFSQRIVIEKNVFVDLMVPRLGEDNSRGYSSKEKEVF